MSRRAVQALVIGIALLSLAALACSLGGTKATPTPAPTSPPPQPSPTPEAAAPAATLMPTPPPQADTPTPPVPPPSTSEGAPEGEAAPLDLGSLLLSAEEERQGLAQFDSYRTTLRMTFSGLNVGVVEEGTVEIETAYVKEPPAARVKMIIRNAQGEEQMNVEIINTQGTQWVNLSGGEKGWISAPADEDPTAMLEGMGFDATEVLPEVKSTRFVGEEVVNGVRTKHYAFDEKSLAGIGQEMGEISVKGDVWIAVEGNFAVKFQFVAEGKGLFEEGKGEQEGQIDFYYELYDINVPITIEPPAGAALPEDIPIMPDATDQGSMGGMITYSSPSDFQAVLEFYQTEMKANGWTSTGEDFVGEDVATLSYQKGERRVTVMLSVDKDSGRVDVLITIEGP